MSMAVAIRPASLYTQATFAKFAELEKSGRSEVVLAHPSSADLLGEMKRWLEISSRTHEGPWQKARHFTARLTAGASDASSPAWGGIVYAKERPFMAAGVFPAEWLSRHINQKEMYALYNLLRQFCVHHPGGFRRSQVNVKVDNESVVGAFNRGRAKNRVTHDLLIQLFDLQVAYDFMLSLQWIPTAVNGVTDAISRPSRDTIIRLRPEGFRVIWDEMGPFNIDLMACTASARRSAVTGNPLPFFSRYHCQNSSGTDVLSQDVARLPGGVGLSFGFCLPPPLLAGHVLKHVQECKAHAVILLPDVKDYWFPLMQLAIVRSLQIASRGATGIFQWPSPKGIREWRYPRWAMVAYEVDFRPARAPVNVSGF